MSDEVNLWTYGWGACVVTMAGWAWHSWPLLVTGLVFAVYALMAWEGASGNE